MRIRGEEELTLAFQMDKTLEVNKWKRLEGQGAVGGEFFSSSLPSPSTTFQVCLSRTGNTQIVSVARLKGF